MKLVRLWWLTVVLLLHICVGSGSGSKDEVHQQVESSLMSLFGFRKRPKFDRSKVVIPEAMLKEYERQTGKKLDSVTITRPGIHAHTANTMRSFTHIESAVDEKFAGYHNFRLRFDIGSIPKGEVLKTAELVLNRDTIELMGDHDDYYQTVTVLDILRPGRKDKGEKPMTRVVDVKMVDVRKSGSVSLNVHPAVVRWREFPTKNFGLLVRVTGKRKGHHVRLRRSINESEDRWAKKQPVLFAYTDDQRYPGETGKTILEKRRKRAASKRPKKHRTLCKRHSMFVNFTDVGWANWIVAPAGYDAFYCSGDCKFPLSHNMNTTNHAIMQTIVNMHSDSTVPNSCCVPTHLSSISMLYLDDDKKVVLKNYKEMTVEGCGCR